MTSRERSRIAVVLVSLATVAWAYWTTLLDMSERWSTDPQYSHGYLVPLFAGYLLWKRRSYLSTIDQWEPRWWGLGIVVVAVAMRFVGYIFYQSWLESGSLLVCLLGITAAVGGRQALKWAGPSILFLVFMLPLPYRFQTMLGGTLQRVATIASTYALQTLGVPAVSEGNLILLTNTKLGVAEACSGLSMLITFFALTTAVAILTQRNFIEKFVIVMSALLLAVLANVVRITATGVLFEAEQGEMARVVFHDLAGWLMMPLALGMLLFELFLLDRVVVPVNNKSKKN